MRGGKINNGSGYMGMGKHGAVGHKYCQLLGRKALVGNGNCHQRAGNSKKWVLGVGEEMGSRREG